MEIGSSGLSGLLRGAVGAGAREHRLLLEGDPEPLSLEPDEEIDAAAAQLDDEPPGIDSVFYTPGARPELRQPSPSPQVPAPKPRNEPGHWDMMISYTQRDPTSETLAHCIHGEMLQRGKTVWLDVKMATRDEGAMEEAVKNSRCVIAIVSSPSAQQSSPSLIRWLKELWQNPTGGAVNVDNAYHNLVLILSPFR